MPKPKIRTNNADNTFYNKKERVMVKPAEKGALAIEEGTVQRNPNGRSVSFVPKSNESTITDSGTKKIVDPKSRKLESENQKTLRTAALEAHKGVDLEQRYKEGQYVTYGTKKGDQVAGRITRGPGKDAEYKDVEKTMVTHKRDVQSVNTGTKEQQTARIKELEGKGYKNIPGTQNYHKPETNEWVDKDKASQALEKKDTRLSDMEKAGGTRLRRKVVLKKGK
jgi:hypothetical protein